MSRIEPVKPAAKFRNPIRTKRNSAVAAVVIVVVSVLAINVAIKMLNGSREYLVAAAPARAGATLQELQTRTISLNLGQAAADYLAPGAKLDGLVLGQPLAAGDLVMKRDLIAQDASAQAVRLSLSPKNALPTKLVAGTSVDIWAATNDGGGIFGEPEMIAQNVQVYATPGGAGLFGEAANKLEISVDEGMVKPILQAVLHADAISVVAHESVQ